jgi:hypothetical protein
MSLTRRILCVGEMVIGIGDTFICFINVLSFLKRVKEGLWDHQSFCVCVRSFVSVYPSCTFKQFTVFYKTW